MGLKNANSSPGVWLALLLVLVVHTLALTTHLDQVADGDFPKNEERSENDSFLQGTTPRGGKDMPIILDKVKETVDDDKRTVTEGDSGKSINATEINSTNVSSDETIQKTTVDEIATTLKTTPARITLQELEPIPTTATIDFEKHLTTRNGSETIEKTVEESEVESASVRANETGDAIIEENRNEKNRDFEKHLTTSNGSETIEKTVEESEVESPSVRANETGDAIIEENRNEKIRDSGVKPLTSTTREFELYEENENFEEHTNSEFAEGTTTPSTKLVGVDRQKIVGDFHKNTERFDTEQDKRDAGSEDAISLVNDTNVNYHKHFENGTRKTDGNDTNSDGGVNLEHAPKHEVEIFKNVTYPSILRFSEDSGNDSVADNTTPYYPTSRPKGRTISITGDNDLSSEERKIVNHTDVNEATSDTVMRMFPKKSVSTEKPTELKPYPYIKSETKLSDDQLVTEIPKRTEESTEEISAFENTIGGKKSDEKIVVTEPESSVLVENSIQQFKPIHNKRSGNSSRVNSTFDAPVASTAWSLGTDGNLATKNEAEVTEEPVKIQVENGNRSQINNDVPQDHLSKSTTTVKSPLILSEVRENNIETIIGKTNGTNNETASTPVSKKLIDPDSEVSVRNVTRTTSGPGEGRVSNSTERTETVSNSFSTSNEIQSEHEDATSMVRNQFTVTEGSTQRANFSTSTEVFTNVPNATEKLSADIETTVSLPVTISSTTISTKESPSGMPVFQSTVTKSVDENVPNVTRIEKTSENHGSTRSFTEPIIGRTTTVSYKFIELTTTEMDSTVSQSDVTSSDGTSTVTNLTNETSVATKSQESTTGGSIGQNETTVPMEVETSGTEEPAPSTIPNFEITTTSSSEIEATTIIDQSNTTDFPVSKNSSTEVYTYTSSKSPIDHSIHGRIDATTTGQSDDPEVVKKTTMVTDTEPAIEQTTTVSNIEVIVPFETTTLPTTTTTTQSTTEQTTSTSEPPDFSPSGDGVTLFVRMIIDGSWSDVCQVLKTLRQSLANLLTEYAERPVYPRNIVLYQPQCIVENVPSANLTPVLLYVVDDNGDFDYSMTEALPSLHRQSSIVFPLPILSVEKLVQEHPTESDNHAIAVVAVSSVAFICLVLLAGLLFIMRKRQTRFNYGERCRPVSLDAFRVDSVSAYNSVRRKGLTRASKRSYGNPAFEDSSVTPTHPLNFAGLSSFCNDLTAITEEFSGIPQVTARMDELPAGAEVKNRYANVAPLPETRVLLQKINNEPLTEYINASYVRGPKNATKYYIACQAPMESTVSDFWRMIWEQQSKVIIMLTDIVENGVEKCVEYIPPSEVTDCHRLYGDYQVTLKKREAKEKYAISTLHLKNLENNTYREVYHIWYLWPTNGVPSNGTGLIAVLLEARALQRGAPGPIVTHCSPGTGRTGTLIALDLGIRQYEITRTVDVPRVVYTIRRDRAGAVQTKEQYAFIYKALNLYAAKLAGGALESM